MNYFKLVLILLVLLCQVFAEDSETTTPIYIWDNQAGLTQVQNCSVIKQSKQKFRIAKYFGGLNLNAENLRDFGGKELSNLYNGSVVKIIKGTKKANYEKIEVAGVNYPEIIDQTIRWASERGDQGYLYYRSLLPIEDYVIELKGINSSIGQYLKIASDSNYYRLSCENMDPNREYITFVAYNKNQEKPSALIGIYWDETAILKDINTFPKSIMTDIIPSNEDGEGEQIETIINDANLYNADNVQDNTDDDNIDSDFGPTVINTNEPVGSSEDVVCVNNNVLNVRDSSLDNIIFKAQAGEKVKVFQGWEADSKVKIINGSRFEFVKTQFPNREENDQNIGWVAKTFIKPKSKCPYINGGVILRNYNEQISGLTDEKCCEFPTVGVVTHRFNEGMRRFGASRENGNRIHAACDLYRYKNEPILAVASGQVIRDAYYFYQGTFALEVVHQGGFVVRYGEITGNLPSEISEGAEIQMGQRIAYMGKVNSNCCRPMLHFELYSGEKDGALSTGGTGYQRRSDLLDPTKHLLRWEENRF